METGTLKSDQRKLRGNSTKESRRLMSSVEHEQKKGKKRQLVGLSFEKERGNKCRDLWVRWHAGSFFHMIWWRSQDNSSGGISSSNNNVKNSMPERKIFKVY